MSREHDEFTHVIEAWLDTSADREDPGTVLDRVVAQLDATPQRRFSLPAPRFPIMSNTVRFAIAAAAVGMIALVGINLLPSGVVPGGVGPIAEPSPSVAPSPPTPTPQPIDRSYREVGFIGLPPLGATPSGPGTTELVENFWLPRQGDGPFYRGGVFLYADGRLIWNEYLDDRSTGWLDRSTGWLELRLTSEGIEIVRGRGVETLEAEIPRRLDPALLPTELPANAWADVTVRPYVPSGFAACLFVSDWETPQEDPSAPLSERLAMLPTAAADLLRDRTPVTSAEDFEDPSAAECLGMNLDDARRLGAILREAGLERDEWRNRYLLEYHMDLDGDGPQTQWLNVWFEPLLPDGTITCSSCG